MHTHNIYFLECRQVCKAASAVHKMPLFVWNLTALWIMLVIQYNSNSHLLAPLLQLVYNYPHLGGVFLVPDIQSRIAGFVKAHFNKKSL